MEKRVLCCFIALLLTASPALAQGAESAQTAQVAAVSPVAGIGPVVAPGAAPMVTMDLRPMPLVSRSLTELSSPGATVATTASTESTGRALDTYSADKTGISWLVDALIEPFYLSLLGASLLLFGTVKRKGG